jgi:hypothetical protein
MLVKRTPLDRPLSPERLEANRRNARMSRGPVTARGRAISSLNSRKYDLLPFENPTLPAQLAAHYYGRFTPHGKNERRLVDILVHSERVRRYCLSVEARTCSPGTTEAEVRYLAEALVSASHRLRAVPHYSDAAVCAHESALRQLQAIKQKAA